MGWYILSNPVTGTPWSIHLRMVSHILGSWICFCNDDAVRGSTKYKKQERTWMNQNKSKTLHCTYAQIVVIRRRAMIFMNISEHSLRLPNSGDLCDEKRFLSNQNELQRTTSSLVILATNPDSSPFAEKSRLCDLGLRQIPGGLSIHEKINAMTIWSLDRPMYTGFYRSPQPWTQCPTHITKGRKSWSTLAIIGHYLQLGHPEACILGG